MMSHQVMLLKPWFPYDLLEYTGRLIPAISTGCQVVFLQNRSNSSYFFQDNLFCDPDYNQPFSFFSLARSYM